MDDDPGSKRHEARIKIKMCGVTRLDDALAAAEAGVHALGFVFLKKSPRYVSPEDARIIIEQLPPFVDAVGVFVDAKRSDVEEIVRYCGLQYAQLHGEEPVKYCERLTRLTAPSRVIKAFRVRPGLQADELAPYAPHVQSYLLDSFVKGAAGGTGTAFDWDLIKALDLDRPCILAGGLNPGNVGEAIAKVRPAAVDVSSGVELRPGRKDHRLIGEFVSAVRSATASLE